MKQTDDMIAVILVILIVALPIGWVILTLPSNPYFVVEGEPLRGAAEGAGLEIIHTEDIFWPFPGATGGKIYILRDDSGNTLSLQTQRFESETARNAAILTYSAQGTGKGGTVGKMLVVGHELIYVSPDRAGIFSRIAPAIKGTARTS